MTTPVSEAAEARSRILTYADCTAWRSSGLHGIWSGLGGAREALGGPERRSEGAREARRELERRSEGLDRGGAG